MNTKKIVTIAIASCFLGIAGLATYLLMITSNLPDLISVEKYDPLLVSEVFDRNGEKIGEYLRQRRLISRVDELPPHLLHAFVAAEDASFYEHGGINYLAIVRAFWANIKAGRRAQGASTITQQVARSLLLTSQKTYTRKIKEAVLARRMEKHLTKDEILYLYLNQIYLGHGSYGVKTASQIYFRKDVKDLTIGEAAILAGLPQAPSRYTPVYKPEAAKARQRYVLKRMNEEGYITDEQYAEEAEKPITVYVRKDYKKYAPYYLEVVRQMLNDELGEQMVLDKGIKVYTSLDINKQIEAQKAVRVGLRELDKRQGYRGAKQNISDSEEIAKFLLKWRDQLMDDHSPAKVIQPDGSFPERGPLVLAVDDPEKEDEPQKLPDYIKHDEVIEGIVTEVDDKWGLVYVRFAEQRGLIDFETMKWARDPDPKVRSQYDEIEKPSEALKAGDVIDMKVVGRRFYSTRLNKELQELKSEQGKDYVRPIELPNFKKFALVELEQEPVAQAGLISFDQKTSEVIAMVGGYDFKDSKFNRTIQAMRQTGSAFKTMVYASALDKGFTPATKIIDAPLIYEEEQHKEDSEEVEINKWKPANYNQKFAGDILFRNALIRSLNVPTVKIIEKVNVDWVAQYARRLGVFSPLNMDFTLALGSSSTTLYEITKVFAQFGRLGKRIRPVIIHRVTDKNGEEILNKIELDKKFEKELAAINEEFELKRKAYLHWRRLQDNPEQIEEGQNIDVVKIPLKSNLNDENDEVKTAEATNNSAPKDTADGKTITVNLKKEPPFYFDDPDQLIKPTTAYITTSILQGVIEEPGGTGRRARALGRPAAGKTGTTSGYYDAWFVGYTPDVVSGVWVGFDDERTLGVGEGGGSTALPIWLEYMKAAHEGLPVRNFPVPEGIVFANIDNASGKVASAQTTQFVKQAFLEGSEPQIASQSTSDQQDSNEETEDVRDFYRSDLSE